MAFTRTKEVASPFAASQTVTQVAALISTFLGVSITTTQVIAQMAARSRPGATTSTVVDFTTAETILRVFQEEATV